MNKLLSLEPRIVGEDILEPDVDFDFSFDFADHQSDLCLPITNRG
jgi:hypothetical protein